MNLIQSAKNVMNEATNLSKDNFSAETGITTKNFKSSWLSTATHNSLQAFYSAVQGKSSMLGKGQYQVPLDSLPIDIEIKVFESWIEKMQDQLNYLKQESRNQQRNKKG